ncbi:MAG: hypothetical protein WAU88_07140 [Candidatus Zixiibacteriota bacterium]
MRFSKFTLYLITVAVLVYVVLARTLHMAITDLSAGPVRGVTWLPSLVLAVAMMLFLIFTWRGRTLSLAERGLTLGKKFWPALVYSALWILYLWWKGGSDGIVTHHGRLIELSALLLVSELILRAGLPFLVSEMVGRSGAWTNLVAVMSSGLLFAIAHPLGQSPLWWLGLCLIWSAGVVYFDSVLLAWITDVQRIAVETSIGCSPLLLLWLIPAYIVIALFARLVVRKRVPESASIRL